MGFPSKLLRNKFDRDVFATDFPELFRPHYSKLVIRSMMEPLGTANRLCLFPNRVLVDDKDLQGHTGGGGYAKYGIDAHAGAIVVVRPDGYVGTVAPLERVDAVEAYFAGFLV